MLWMAEGSIIPELVKVGKGMVDEVPEGEKDAMAESVGKVIRMTEDNKGLRKAAERYVKGEEEREKMKNETEAQLKAGVKVG